MAFSLHPADVAFGTAISFLAGVFIVSAGWPLFIFFSATFAVSAIIVVLRRQLVRECALFLVAVVAGAAYYHAFFRIRKAETALPLGKALSFAAVVSDEPQPTEKYLVFAATVRPPLRGNITVFAPPAADYAYGDLLAMSGIIMPPRAEYEYPAVFLPRIERVAAHQGFVLREWMIDLKSAILAAFHRVLPVDEAALLGGITFGARASFSASLRDALTRSGTTHLVAVSGYNITIIIVATRAFFGKIFPRRATLLFATILLALFMFMVGTQPSAVRAAIMGFVALLGREIGEAASMRNLVTFTAAAMTLADPSILTERVAFALSFLSLLGIVYLGPPLRELLCRKGCSAGDGFLGWRESAAMTLSAQLAVMPVLLRTFGQFSLTAVFANVLVIATVPFTMLLGAFLAILGLLSQYLMFFAAKFVGLLLGYQLFVIRLFAGLAVPLPAGFNSAFFFAFYYLLLSAFVFSRTAPRATP